MLPLSAENRQAAGVPAPGSRFGPDDRQAARGNQRQRERLYVELESQRHDEPPGRRRSICV